MGRGNSDLTAENARLRAEVQGLRGDLEDTQRLLGMTRTERDRIRADLKLACVWLHDFDPDWSAAGLERELRAWTREEEGRQDRGRPSPKLATKEVARLENVVHQLRSDFFEVSEHRDRLRLEAPLDKLEHYVRGEVTVEEDGAETRRGFLFYEAREVIIDGDPIRTLVGLRLVGDDGERMLDLSKLIRITPIPEPATPTPTPTPTPLALPDDDPIPF